MKKPQEVILYPLDIKKDESGGLWYRVPTWLVRAFKLKEMNLTGKVKFVIHSKSRVPIEFNGEEQCFSNYFKKNWSKKITRENRKKHSEAVEEKE